MLNRVKVIEQLIPILRPYLTVNPSELSSFRLAKVRKKCQVSNNPFATIEIISMDDIGKVEYGEVVSDVGLQFKKHFDVTVRINTFADDAMFRANILKSNLENPLVIDELTAQGFGYRDTSEIRDLSGLNTTDFEERSRLDIYFNVASGCLETFESINEEDIGKAGVGAFFDIDPVESVNIVSFSGLNIEETDNIDGE